MNYFQPCHRERFLAQTMNGFANLRDKDVVILPNEDEVTVIHDFVNRDTNNNLIEAARNALDEVCICQAEGRL